MAIQQYVTFKLNNEEYGVSIERVREIVHLQEITKIPQAADFIEGIINLRGLIVPIVDLKNRYYGISTQATDTSRIIVISIGDSIMGIVADEVLEVLTLDESLIEPPPSIITQMSNSCGVNGVGKVEDRLIILIDLTEAFTTQEKDMLQEAVTN